MSETSRFSSQNRFVKLVHLVGFSIKKNIKKVVTDVSEKPSGPIFKGRAIQEEYRENRKLGYGRRTANYSD